MIGVDRISTGKFFIQFSKSPAKSVIVGVLKLNLFYTVRSVGSFLINCKETKFLFRKLYIMEDELLRIVDTLPIPSTDNGMEDEVMRIFYDLPIPDGDKIPNIANQSLILKKKLEDQNQRIEKLKIRIKMLTSEGGSQQHLYSLQQQLNAEFDKLDRMLKIKLELHSKSMQPTNIIHLATTEDEDNLPPIMLYAEHNEENPTALVLRQSQPLQRLSSLQRVPPYDHPVASPQRKAEEKFQKIQKKLLELCCNDIGSRSIQQSSNKDAQKNLNDDIKRQFDILYSELRVLEKELFHSDNPDFDSFENSEKNVAFQSLKRQNVMLLEQGEHFQVLFKEQQLEIENYRKKYMQTLQNVMEQHLRITSMEDKSKCSEKKTYEEIVRMKNNLRKKLDHFAPITNMLETCNNKLNRTIKRKNQLEQNYQNICDELRQLKKELANSTRGTYKAKCDSLGAELQKTKELNEFNNKRINDMQLQLQQAKSELERVRVKSTKTIKSTTKKCDFLRSELESRINQLEIELAQSRAITVANSK